MLAVDTNVAVRLVTRDDPIQAERAHQLFQREEIFFPKTALLEIYWVLRSVYGFDKKARVDAIDTLIRLPNVTCEDAGVVCSAVEWARGGMDFADALHLAAARPAGRFATFDRQLVAKARRDSDVVVVLA